MLSSSGKVCKRGVRDVREITKMLSLDTRIQRYLAKCPPAVSGEHGHDQTFKVASALVWGFALSREAALHYLEVYNTGCQPPWTLAELGHKIDSALRSPSSKPVGYLRCYRFNSYAKSCLSA